VNMRTHADFQIQKQIGHQPCGANGYSAQLNNVKSAETGSQMSHSTRPISRPQTAADPYR
jgi:hypothetical protein